MASWSPATASCNHPEDSSDMLSPAMGIGAGVKAFMMVDGGRGSAGSGSNCRSRRMGSRARSVAESSEGVDGDRSWRRDGDAGTAVERKDSGGGGGRGRGRAKKEDVVWVQCDKCERWRKLAPGMRLEDLPDMW